MSDVVDGTCSTMFLDSCHNWVEVGLESRDTSSGAVVLHVVLGSEGKCSG